MKKTAPGSPRIGDGFELPGFIGAGANADAVEARLELPDTFVDVWTSAAYAETFALMAVKSLSNCAEWPIVAA